MKEKRFKEIVSEGIADLFYIWWQELKAVVKDQGVLIFFILVPLGYPLLYTFIYTNETVREVPAVVVDNNRSTLSREYLRLVDAGPDLYIVSHCADMEEAKALLKEGKAYGIIYIPESFSRDIAKGIQTRVTLYCDMSGMLYYKAMLTANTNASLTMNKQIKIERSGNTTERQDEVSSSPIEYEDISIFNPQNGFAGFLKLISQFAYSRGFSYTIHSHYHNHVWLLRNRSFKVVHIIRVVLCEQSSDFIAQNHIQLLRIHIFLVCGTLLDTFYNLQRSFYAHIRSNQHLFQIIQHLIIHFRFTGYSTGNLPEHTLFCFR